MQQLLQALKFVRGAVAKKDFIPALKHFKIDNGFIYGSNGVMQLSAPIEADLCACPQASTFIKAIERCKDTVRMTVSDQLTIKSGKFRASVPCIDINTFPLFNQEPYTYVENQDICAVLQKLQPFIGTDASRPWCCGVLLGGGYAYTTNNITAVQANVAAVTPYINIPGAAVDEIVRIKEEPLKIGVGKKSVCFVYPNGSQLHTCVLECNQWPNIPRLLDLPNNANEIDDIIFEYAEQLLPFTDEMSTLYFKPLCISTHARIEEGAAYTDIPYIDFEAVFHGKMLLLLKDVCERADFSTYPKPCYFEGHGVRGVIVGLRK